jgi:hypothetical protein
MFVSDDATAAIEKPHESDLLCLGQASGALKRNNRKRGLVIRLVFRSSLNAPHLPTHVFTEGLGTRERLGVVKANLSSGSICCSGALCKKSRWPTMSTEQATSFMLSSQFGGQRVVLELWQASHVRVSFRLPHSIAQG